MEPENYQTLIVARAILKNEAARLYGRAHSEKSGATGAYCGIVSARAEAAGDAIFGFLNGAASYLGDEMAAVAIDGRTGPDPVPA